jgi:hypothetical protein
MVIGRGRRREHLIYENKRGGKFAMVSLNIFYCPKT